MVEAPSAPSRSFIQVSTARSTKPTAPATPTGPHLDLRPYVARYCEDLPALTGSVGESALARLATAAFPHWLPEPETLARVGVVLADPDLPSALRRCSVAGATLSGGRLRVRFEPDPDQWPSSLRGSR